jgi:hypothetical protein
MVRQNPKVTKHLAVATGDLAPKINCDLYRKLQLLLLGVRLHEGTPLHLMYLWQLVI